MRTRSRCCRIEPNDDGADRHDRPVEQDPFEAVRERPHGVPRRTPRASSARESASTRSPPSCQRPRAAVRLLLQIGGPRPALRQQIPPENGAVRVWIGNSAGGATEPRSHDPIVERRDAVGRRKRSSSRIADVMRTIWNDRSASARQHPDRLALATQRSMCPSGRCTEAHTVSSRSGGAFHERDVEPESS